MTDEVLQLFKQGFAVVPLEPRGKKPVQGFEQWQKNRVQTEDHIRQLWARGANVGVLLGQPSNDLHDIDVDDKAALPFTDILFGHCPAFGRTGKPRSHRLAIIKDGQRRGIWKDPDGAMLIELRGDGHYTMFPPSVHPSGEPVAVQSSAIQLPEMKWADAHLRCGIAALLALLGRCYPKQSGCRDELAMAMARVLIEAGLDDATCDKLLVAWARGGGDEEADKRGKTAGTRAKLESGEPVTGLTRALEILDLADTDVAKLARRWLANGDRKRIIVAEGRLNRILDEAEQATGPVVYEYGTELVRIVRQERPDPDSEPVRRDKGALQIVPVDRHWLVQEWARKADWRVPTTKGEPRPIDPPIKYANHYLARRGDRKVPTLTGFVSAPTLRADGSVLDQPGYDEATGLIYDPHGVMFPAVPPQPSEEQARDAMLRLAHPFRAFPFVGKADESVALAMVLTGLIRRTLPTAPLFLVDAPLRGSGKTIIAEVAGVVATGHRPTAMSVGEGSAEELRKRLFAALLSGDAVILLDNLTCALTGDFLCSVLTSPTVQDRILGQSANVTVPTRVLLTATGNNIATRGDLDRRAVKCRIDAKTEHPEQRQFNFHPVDEAQAGRPELVVAGLTALRWAKLANGHTPVKKLGSYAEWAWVQNTLVWLGWANPTDTQEDIRCLDNETTALAELLHAWHAEHELRRALTVKQLWDASSPELKELMAECTPKPGAWSGKSFGRYLNRHKDQIVGGLHLRRGPDRHRQATWEVVDVTRSQQEELPWAS